jgi:hypothetical protein
MIQFTEDQVNNFNDEQLERFIIAYGDGQGDTYIRTLKQLYNNSGYSEPDSGYEGVAPYIQAIDDVYDEYGGNMVEIRYIENNRLLDCTIV